MPSAYQNPIYLPHLESISILLHKVACFHGLSLCTLCITWRVSFEDPHLMTSICWLQNPSENIMPICKSSHLFTKYAFHFLQNVMIIEADLKITVITNLFYDNSISKFCPCIRINYLGITSFWTFALCQKNF